jgi:hypothetical protein
MIKVCSIVLSIVISVKYFEVIIYNLGVVGFVGDPVGWFREKTRWASKASEIRSVGAGVDRSRERERERERERASSATDCPVFAWFERSGELGVSVTTSFFFF